MPRGLPAAGRRAKRSLRSRQTSGRQRINIHGAIDLETGQTRMIEALTIDAASTMRLLQSIEALHPMLALIHVFLDNARVIIMPSSCRNGWPEPGRRIKLHFIPTYCLHLNPIGAAMGASLHRNVTHNKCYATCAQFAMRRSVFCVKRFRCGIRPTSVIRSPDNFRVINPKDFSGHDVNGVYSIANRAARAQPEPRTLHAQNRPGSGHRAAAHCR